MWWTQKNISTKTYYNNIILSWHHNGHNLAWQHISLAQKIIPWFPLVLYGFLFTNVRKQPNRHRKNDQSAHGKREPPKNERKIQITSKGQYSNLKISLLSQALVYHGLWSMAQIWTTFLPKMKSFWRGLKLIYPTPWVLGPVWGSMTATENEIDKNCQKKVCFQKHSQFMCKIS